jgi:DNA repair ATPase RecN
MAAVTSAPGIPVPRLPSHEQDTLSTIPDPRSRSAIVSGSNSGTGTPVHHPDLSNEVATLSNKLINAINHQTDLDDSLQATRQELETAQQRIQQLETAASVYAEELAQGVWIRTADFESEMNEMRTLLAEEKRLRTQAEKDRKGMEQELETLTSALFEEANQVCLNQTVRVHQTDIFFFFLDGCCRKERARHYRSKE